MVGADETTELWRPSKELLFVSNWPHVKLDRHKSMLKLDEKINSYSQADKTIEKVQTTAGRKTSQYELLCCISIYCLIYTNNVTYLV